ncbi:MAG TPA: cyclopropane-fatty-acyl-phospholipid synthase family protein [Myxococcota bacterium]
MLGIRLAEAGRVPDALVRMGIRQLLRRRLREVSRGSGEAAQDANRAFRAELRASPVALVPDLANEQHYEVAPAFFEQVLGPRLKYSGGLWPEGVADLAASEDAMLSLTCERAEVADGMRVLDLGCGWGSLSLWMAERYPHCRILAVSNSKPQREFILGRCARLGLDNVEVVTADVNHFAPDRRFDRVLSVEMFEHVRNHELLLARIASWLEPGGKLFVHHFAHREYAYPYLTQGPDDWMGRHFFSGGIMPSDDLLLHCQRDLVVEDKWVVSGLHYQKTCEAWLARQDERRDALLPILAGVYGSAEAGRWFQRWRIFFLACAELFGYRAGNEWWVTHVRMASREGAR